MAPSVESGMEFNRVFDAGQLLSKKSFFLFGPRNTGKTTLLEQQLPELKRIDLLDPEVLATYASRPKRLLELGDEKTSAIIIDEIQKLPALLDVVQLAIQKQKKRFILTGSSARKLKRQGVNLLGGRAWEAHLHPLTWKEIPDFDLMRYLSRGGLPGIYLSEHWKEDLKAYLSLYLQEEIIQEAATRNVPAFSRFLDILGATSGEELVIESIASDAGVKASTVRNYMDILRDTLLVFEALPYTQTQARKAVSRSKVWVFDVGLANTLSKRTVDQEGSAAFGKAFEHFIVREVQSYLSYKRTEQRLHYWRTFDQYEVDIIVPGSFGCEVKASERVTDKHLQSLRVLKKENLLPRHLVVCREPERRTVDGIEILPWQEFMKELWSGNLL
jgi:predicted AAA+ superfamily ATPase